jgi:hypothetical protein
LRALTANTKLVMKIMQWETVTLQRNLAVKTLQMEQLLEYTTGEVITSLLAMHLAFETLEITTPLW